MILMVMARTFLLIVGIHSAIYMATTPGDQITHAIIGGIAIGAYVGTGYCK